MKLAEDGLIEAKPTPPHGFAAELIRKGGVAYRWHKPGTCVSLELVRVRIGDSSRAAWILELDRHGYAHRSDAPAGHRFASTPDLNSGLNSAAVIGATALTILSAPDFAKWVVPDD